MKTETNHYPTYDERIAFLEGKGLVIDDHEAAKEAFMSIGYFTLIEGYGTAFTDPASGNYVNASLDDIMALYQFDVGIREMTSHYLNIIEVKFRNVISSCFAERYGEKEESYLNPDNFSKHPNDLARVEDLIEELDYLAHDDLRNESLLEERAINGEVRLWVMMRALDIDEVAEFYNLLSPETKDAVAKHFVGVKKEHLKPYLHCIAAMRNICDHNERIFGLHLSFDLPDTPLHQNLSIPRVKGRYAMGKNDYFAFVVALRYLLGNDEEFEEFMDDLKFMFAVYSAKSAGLILDPDEGEVNLA